LAALLASKIPSGVPSASLRVIDQSPNLFLFDHSELARFQLKKAALPRGSAIINAPKSILNQYAHWVVGGILVFVLQLVLILLLVNTIRQRRSAEVSLRESDARFRAFFDNSPSIMYMKDLQHRLTMVNTKCREFHNAGDATFVGARGGKSFDEAKRHKVEELDRKVIEGGVVITSDLSVTSQDGDKREFIITKLPILDENKKVFGIGDINTDVTTLRKREAELTEARN